MGKPAGTRRRRQKRGKYGYDKNRRKDNISVKKKLNPVVVCEPVRKAWDNSKTLMQNMDALGLAHDANAVIKYKSTKEQLRPAFEGEVSLEKVKAAMEKKNEPTAVVKILEEAAAKKKKRFRIPKEQVTWITSMIDRYGDDYHAMCIDSRNLDQFTPKQLRAKVKQFFSVPEQSATYLKDKGMLKPLDV